MSRGLRLAELRESSPEKRKALLSGLVEAARQSPNGEAERLEAEIREYERRYEVSSERMLQELAEGTRKETAEIASWLMRLRVRERIGGGPAS